MKHNLEEFMRENYPPPPDYPEPDEMDHLINEAARRMMKAEDDLILAAHFRAQELGMGVLVKRHGDLDFRRDGDNLIVTALTEAGPDPSVPKGQIYYEPKEYNS